MILMDKVYIITGGSSGLGKAFTHDLVVNFAKVIITGRDKKKLEKVARDLGCLAFHADVRSDEDIDASGPAKEPDELSKEQVKQVMKLANDTKDKALYDKICIQIDYKTINADNFKAVVAKLNRKIN